MSDTLLTDLPQTVCDQIEIRLPKLKTCEPHEGKFDLGELKKRGLAAPAVLVSVLGAKQDTTYADAAHSFLLKMSAYVLVRDGMGAKRDIAAGAICQILLGLVPDKDWDLEGIGLSRNVAMHCLVSGKVKDVAASLWAVTWDQPISFFEPEELALGVEVYVSRAPEIGVAHEDDYEQIGGQRDE